MGIWLLPGEEWVWNAQGGQTPMGRTEVANSGGLSSLYMSRIGFWKYWNSLLRFRTRSFCLTLGPHSWLGSSGWN